MSVPENILDEMKRLGVAPAATPATSPSSRRFAPDIEERINRYSLKHGVDPELTRRMMNQESGGKQKVVSPKGARWVGVGCVAPSAVVKT